MSGITISVDDRRIQESLRALRDRIGNLKQPLSEIGQTLVTLTDLSFREQRDPWGNAWKALAASTIARRRKGPRAGNSDQILRDTGLLANSINYQSNNSRVEVGYNVQVEKYARIHQLGGKAGRGHKVTIPARAYLPIRPDGTADIPANTINEILDILHRHLMP